MSYSGDDDWFDEAAMQTFKAQGGCGPEAVFGCAVPVASITKSVKDEKEILRYKNGADESVHFVDETQFPSTLRAFLVLQNLFLYHLRGSESRTYLTPIS